VDPGFVSPTAYDDYGVAVHLSDYQTQSMDLADRSIHVLEKEDTW
jgi:hypothetical protein